MEFKIAKEVEFIPEWRDNQKEKKPIKIKLRYMSAAERDDSFSLDSERNLIVDKRTQLNTSVVSIENLTVDMDGEKVEVTKGSDLMDTPGLLGLYNETIVFIIEMNAELNSKNL